MMAKLRDACLGSPMLLVSETDAVAAHALQCHNMTPNHDSKVMNLDSIVNHMDYGSDSILIGLLLAIDINMYPHHTTGVPMSIKTSLIISTLTFSFLACTDKNDDTNPTDTSDTSDTNDTSNPEETGNQTTETYIIEEGNCLEADVIAGGTPLDTSTVQSISIDWWPTGNVAQVITTQAELETFKVENEVFTIDSIDFEENTLLIAAINVGSTCGLDDSIQHLVDIDGQPYLELEVTNPDATCEDICDMAWMETLAYIIPKTESASVCSRLIETCE